jgi:hypothetical protein
VILDQGRIFRCCDRKLKHYLPFFLSLFFLSLFFLCVFLSVGMFVQHFVVVADTDKPRSVLFWDIVLCQWVISAQGFKTPLGSPLQVLNV